MSFDLLLPLVQDVYGALLYSALSITACFLFFFAFKKAVNSIIQGGIH